MFRIIFLIVWATTWAFPQSLHLYGGKKHEIYLGCLNCFLDDPNSIWNVQGKYGNEYSLYSIWNEYSLYGNEYSLYSPWNDFVNTYPPIVLDEAGNFYGYFSINKHLKYRARFDLALILYENYSLIRQDVEKAYWAIFEGTD